MSHKQEKCHVELLDHNKLIWCAERIFKFWIILMDKECSHVSSLINLTVLPHLVKVVNLARRKLNHQKNTEYSCLLTYDRL